MWLYFLLYAMPPRIADSGARWEFSKAARMSSICAHCDASGLALMRDHATARLKAATANE